MGLAPYFTVVVLVAGVLGGLVLVMAVIFFCKYCIHTPKPLKRQAAIVNRATSSDRSLRRGGAGSAESAAQRECESLVSSGGETAVAAAGNNTHSPASSNGGHTTADVEKRISLPNEDEENDIDAAFAHYKETLKVSVISEEVPARQRGEEPGTAAADDDTTWPALAHADSVFDTPPLTPAHHDAPTIKKEHRLYAEGPKLIHSKSVGGYNSTRYYEGDYHHLKKAKIDRSPAVAEFVKQHSVGGVSLDSAREQLEEIPPSLRLDPIDRTKRTSSSGSTSKVMFRDQARSASSQSMSLHKDSHHVDHRVPRGSSLHRIQRALSEDRSQSYPESLAAKSVEPKERIIEEDVYHGRGREPREMKDSREKLPRMMSREERMKAYAQDRTKSMYDTRARAFLHHKTRSASTIKVPSDEMISHELSHSQSASRLRRPSIGDMRAISPNMSRRLGERPISPFLKKQRSMSEDLPVSPLVYKQQSSSRDSISSTPLPSGSLHQVAVEVHHDPTSSSKSPIRSIHFKPPSSGQRLTVKKDAYHSRSFELQTKSPKDSMPQRRVKSYDEEPEVEQYENHDRLEITQFLRGAFYNADFDVMTEVGAPGELKSKVRYNDIGSLEEISEDRPIDEIVTETLTVDDSETETSSTINGNNPKYKDLWNLRATLEEEEDFSDTIRMEDMTSPDDQSAEEKEKSPGTSYTTSFESNTEPVGEHDLSEHTSEDTVIRIASSNLLAPHQNRRQTYRTILDRRVKQSQPSAQNSLDSMETMETDGEVSDTSRHEVTTTSFESTTGSNTDSTGDGTNSHKLQQMRGDSGYKSLETQQSQGQTGASDGHARVGSRKQIHFVLGECREDSGHGKSPSPISEVPGPSQPSAHPSVKGPIPSTSQSSQRSSKNSSQFDRRNGKTASKKRRDFRSDRKAIQVYDSIQEPESDQPSGDSFDEPTKGGQKRFSVFSRLIKSKSERRPTLSRDYSVDSKSDAMFNEFTRYDPSMGTGSRRRSRLLAGNDALAPSSVPASFDMTGGGRRERLSPAIRSASLGSDSSATSSLMPMSPHASIDEEDDPNKSLLPPQRHRPHGSPGPSRGAARSSKESLQGLEGRPDSWECSPHHIERGATMPNIPVIKLPTEDEDK